MTKWSACQTNNAAVLGVVAGAVVLSPESWSWICSHFYELDSLFK